MTPVEFKEQNVVYGKGQDEYLPLPAFKYEDGSVVTCWELDEDEVKQLLLTRRIWIANVTFNKPLQPIFVTVDKSKVL